MSVEIMTDDNYQDLISNSPKLVVDVWAEWCGPCKRTTPVFEDMASENSNGSVVFAKLDADNNRNAASDLKVTSLPTFVVFEEGSMKKKWSGADVGRLRKEISAVTKD